MRRLLIGALGALCATLLLACGDATGPDGPDIPDGPLEMALVSGGGQEVQVTDTLPSDIVVQVTKGGSPLPDQLVDWTVTRDNCGSPFVTTTRTDSEGQTGNRLVAGTRAWTRPDGPDTCQMEVRYALTVADTVQAHVDTTVSYRVEPGAPATALIQRRSYTDTIGHGDTIDIRRHLQDVEDQYGNPVPVDTLASWPGDSVRWLWSDRMAYSSVSGPSGFGWTTVLDTAELRSRGYTVRKSVVDCADDSDTAMNDTTYTWVYRIETEIEGVDLSGVDITGSYQIRRECV